MGKNGISAADLRDGAKLADTLIRGKAPAKKGPRELPGLPTVPAWHDGLAPPGLRGWILDIAHRMQCPPEFPAVGAIVGAASAIGCELVIRPKEHDDWQVAPNLWGMLIGRPSAMKSPPLTEVLRPLTALQLKEAMEHEAREFDREIAKARKKSIRAKLDKAARAGKELDSFRQEYAECEAELAELERQRRYVVNDSTTEKLGELLSQSKRGLLLYRDELSGWLRTLDKQGHENDRSFYLEAWTGTGSYCYDRVLRGTIAIERCCMSVVGTVQPSVLQSYLRAALDGTSRDDGLVQRCQMMVYPDPPRQWRNVDQLPSLDARRVARATLERLANSSAADFGASVASYGFPFLRFDRPAQTVFNDWRHELENRLRQTEEHPAIEAHLLKYASLMPSLALVFHLLEDEAGGPVSHSAAKLAVYWCNFLEAHARRVYAAVSMPDIDAAKRILAKLRNGKLSPTFTERDVYLSGWTGLTEVETVKAATELLEHYGWLNRTTVKTGGRPKEVLKAHTEATP